MPNLSRHYYSIRTAKWISNTSGPKEAAHVFAVHPALMPNQGVAPDLRNLETALQRLVVGQGRFMKWASARPGRSMTSGGGSLPASRVNEVSDAIQSAIDPCRFGRQSATFRIPGAAHLDPMPQPDGLAEATTRGASFSSADSEQLNQRRVDLIVKKYGRGLSPTESVELDRLTELFRNRLRLELVPYSAALEEALEFARRHGFKPNSE